MQFDNFDKKLRLSYFLPYGIISQSAIALSVYQEEPAANNPNNIASLVYDPDMPMSERVAKSYKVHDTRTRRIGALQSLGYAKLKKIHYGKYKWQTITCYQPTPYSLYQLTSTVDEAEEQRRFKSIKLPRNRTPKRKKYTATEDYILLTKTTLNELAAQKNNGPEEEKMFRQFLLESVEYCDFSPLAAEPLLAQTVSMTPSDRGPTLYRNARLANIEALFRANNYLTSIDRRPIPTVPAKPLNGLDRLDIQDFSRYVLEKWYKDNPDFYQFMQTAPNADYRKKWLTTPAFYSYQDIPGFTTITNDSELDIELPNLNQTGTNQLIQHTCAGIAIGTHENYIVHHTRQSETPWYEGIESNTAKSAKAIFRRLSKDEPFYGATRDFRNAIIVCPTQQQFIELISKAGEMPKDRLTKERRVGRPYDNVNIILLNPSGVTQLRYLMSSNPLHYDELLKRKLLTYEGFVERLKSGSRREDIFAVTYKRVPVFLAYSLNWQNLYWAVEKYKAGEKFYVCCYPEQVAYLEKIMPEVEFL